MKTLFEKMRDNRTKRGESFKRQLLRLEKFHAAERALANNYNNRRGDLGHLVASGATLDSPAFIFKRW